MGRRCGDVARIALLVVATFGCGGAERTRVSEPARAEGEVVEVRAQIPDGMPAEGTAIAIAFTPSEIAAGVSEDPAHFTEILTRVQVTRLVRAVDGAIALDVRITERPATVQLAFDTAGLGLEALFGAPSGIALGRVEVPVEGAPLEASLAGRPFEQPAEACTGEREELLVLDAPETRHQGDRGERRLCVRLPPSYAGADAQRYPVVLMFPGFSGWHANGNTWRQRALFERIGAELGVEAIYVGVGTRTAEGTSYLDTSERFGDWDRYASERIVTELDARYRTLPRRATVGHSTGGWNAVALATRHPELFVAMASSSPDALDLDTWMLDERGALRPEWLAWIRVEDALSGPGQMVSYAAAWSPDASAPRGFLWPVDLSTGALRPEVYARWQARSPVRELATPEGLARVRQLSGRIVITAGRADEFGLFAPSERYVARLREAGIEVEWRPTDFGHFGHDEERFGPLARFLLTRLAPEEDGEVGVR